MLTTTVFPIPRVTLRENGLYPDFVTVRVYVPGGISWMR
jgi:hypothetical protein